MSLIRGTLSRFAITAAGAMFALSAPTASAQDVACGAGGSGIQAAINGGDDFVTFTGTCAEGIFIGRDGVTIKGFGPGPDVIALPDNAPAGLGPEDSNVFVTGSTNVRFENLTITGGSGVFFADGSAVRFEGVTVNPSFFAVSAVRGSVLRVNNSTITQGAPLRDDGCGGLCIFENSSLRMTNTTITGNSSNPIAGGPLAVYRDASATLRGGNTITNNGTEAAVGVFFNSSLRQDDPSVDSGDPSAGLDTFDGTNALVVLGNSYVDIRAAVLTGNSSVGINSTLKFSGAFGDRPEDTDVNGDIVVSEDSMLFINDPLIEINGDITCADDESRINTDTFAGAHTINCTDFNNGKIKVKVK